MAKQTPTKKQAPAKQKPAPKKTNGKHAAPAKKETVKRAPGELSPMRAKIFALCNGKMTLDEIAERLGCTPTNVGTTLGFMKKLHGITHVIEDGKVKAQHA